MSSDALSKKVILVIGGTGAQGLAVVDALLETSADGSPSPYSVRVLTRDTTSSRAKQIATKGVEVVKGSVDDFTSVLAAMAGAYGVFVNTDSFTLGEEKEIFIGMRIFELAKQIGTLQHYVWSGSDYSTKKGGYNPIYRCEHEDGKARVSDWMRAQPSVVSDNAMSWSILSTVVYMEMLNIPMMGPLHKRADGTYVFATPVGDGHVPFITLADVGFFARHIFDYRKDTSARELEVASDWVDWPTLVSTFTKVTGKPAVYVPLTIDGWFALWDQDDINKPLANEKQGVADGSTTWRENFSCWWAGYRDDLITRDLEWNRRVNPLGHTLESWMRETGYTGDINTDLLKNMQDGWEWGVSCMILGTHSGRAYILTTDEIKTLNVGGRMFRHFPGITDLEYDGLHTPETPNLLALFIPVHSCDEQSSVSRSGQDHSTVLPKLHTMLGEWNESSGGSSARVTDCLRAHANMGLFLFDLYIEVQAFWDSESCEEMQDDFRFARVNLKEMVIGDLCV